jgi:hypothetical protein
VEVIRDKFELIEDDWMSCKQDMNMCSKGSAPLLRRWRILEWDAYLFERWHPSHPPLSHLSHFGSTKEMWQTSPTTWLLSLSHLVHPLLQVVRPPSWASSPILLFKQAFTHFNLVGSWNIILTIVNCCNTLVLLNKRLWRSIGHCCYVWMLG